MIGNISNYLEAEFNVPDGWYPKVTVSYHDSPITLSIQWIDDTYYVSSDNIIQNWGQYDLNFLQTHGIMLYIDDFSEETELDSIVNDSKQSPDSFDISGISSIETLIQILEAFGSIRRFDNKSQYFKWYTDTTYSHQHIEPRIRKVLGIRDSGKPLSDISDLYDIIGNYNIDHKYYIGPNQVTMNSYLRNNFALKQSSIIEYAEYDPHKKQWFVREITQNMTEGSKPSTIEYIVSTIIPALSRIFERVRLSIEKNSYLEVN